MSITAYTGLPRQGKSYGVVENVIIPALKKKRVVYTNIPMQESKCLDQFGMTVRQFKTQDLIDNDNWFTEVFESGAILILDEAWRLWPSGMRATEVKEQHKTFLAEHGHLVSESGFSTNVVIVTQDLSQLATFCTCLIEVTYRVVKMSKLGADKRYRVDVFTGAIKGQAANKDKLDRQIFGKFEKKTYSLYISQTKSEGGAWRRKRYRWTF